VNRIGSAFGSANRNARSTTAWNPFVEGSGPEQQIHGLPDESHNAYRMTASCIPAALEYFSDKLKETEQATQPVPGEEGTEWEEAEELTAWTGPARQALAEIVESSYQVPKHDSKLEELLSAFKAIWQDDETNRLPQRKIIVFSFFRRTLDYLARALSRPKDSEP